MPVEYSKLASDRILSQANSLQTFSNVPSNIYYKRQIAQLDRG